MVIDGQWIFTNPRLSNYWQNKKPFKFEFFQFQYQYLYYFFWSSSINTYRRSLSNFGLVVSIPIEEAYLNNIISFEQLTSEFRMGIHDTS